MAEHERDDHEDGGPGELGVALLKLAVVHHHTAHSRLLHVAAAAAPTVGVAVGRAGAAWRRPARHRVRRSVATECDESN